MSALDSHSISSRSVDSCDLCISSTANAPDSVSVSASAGSSSLFDSSVFFRHFVSGAFSLSFSIGCFHSFDTLKSIRQTEAAPKTPIFRHLNVRVLSRGLLPSLLGSAPQGGLRFASYEFAKARLNELNFHPNSPVANAGLAAVFGDLMSSVIKVPRELITIQMQLHNGARCHSLSEAVRMVYREAGILGFYRGFASTCLRDLPFMTILFGIYESATRQCQCQDSSTPRFLIGAAAGGFAGFVTTPFDVMKTAVQSRLRNQLAAKPISILDSIRLVREESQGKFKFFRGAAFRTFWWSGVAGLFFPTYEQVNRTMQNWGIGVEKKEHYLPATKVNQSLSSRQIPNEQTRVSEIDEFR